VTSFIEAGGRRLEIRWLRPSGPAVAGRPTLVFLHEGLGSVSLWKRFPDSVAEATGCPGLVYSRYGCGKSEPLDAPRAVDYLHREALEVLPDLLARLEIARPILIGHSDGASIALIHAGANRWPVRGVVAIAPHVFVEDLSIASIAQAKVAFETTDLPARLARHHDDAASTFRGWNDIWLHPDFRRWNIEDYLPGIRCPVLLIQGHDDQYGTMAQIEAVERQVAGPVKAVKLSACGHSPHVDQPVATLEAIAAFVAMVSGAPEGDSAGPA
jgi:pimeloyl-ACP methyl ester carboxylesterase